MPGCGSCAGSVAVVVGPEARGTLRVPTDIRSRYPIAPTGARPPPAPAGVAPRRRASPEGDTTDHGVGAFRGGSAGTQGAAPSCMTSLSRGAVLLVACLAA